MHREIPHDSLEWEELRLHQGDASRRCGLEMSGWYYKRDDGEVVGLYSDDEIIHCATRGGIALDSLVKHEEKTKGEWVSASRIGGLRTRIESSGRQSQKSTVAPVIRGYDPARQSWQSRFSLVRRWLQHAVGWFVGVASATATIISRKNTSYVCTTCEKEFAASSTGAQCPVCGQLAKVVCGSCGFAAGAHRFSQVDCECPRCGTKVALPGAQSGAWRIAGLVGVSVVIVTVLIALTVAGILASPPTNVVPNGIEIVALLPDPEGRDEGREQVTIVNRALYAVQLHGWKLLDRSGNSFELMGKIPRGAKIVVTMTVPSMSLSNNGDEIWLVDPRGVARSKVAFKAEQVQSGLPLKFEQ